ncbi:hypothetical protein [Sporocytophaga myxococcoides]|uniref:hypothetical protein n=1 Tax=Sporocytophaga myxococcoides TaxID=153721 RepID=UPI00048A9B85|nr:hypothetical protein [Sporocytophaga myxococcoides]
MTITSKQTIISIIFIKDDEDEINTIMLLTTGKPFNKIIWHIFSVRSKNAAMIGNKHNLFHLLFTVKLYIIPIRARVVNKT